MATCWIILCERARKFGVRIGTNKNTYRRRCTTKAFCNIGPTIGVAVLSGIVCDGFRCAIFCRPLVQKIRKYSCFTVILIRPRQRRVGNTVGDDVCFLRSGCVTRYWARTLRWKIPNVPSMVLVPPSNSDVTSDATFDVWLVCVMSVCVR